MTEKGSNFKIKTEGMEEESGFKPGDGKAFDEIFQASAPHSLAAVKPKANTTPKERSAHQGKADIGELSPYLPLPTLSYKLL